ncbi:MAG: transposase family protein [Ectothiorhodospiraceae bacterium]|nr:transposase family protein [Ectothiorhodospiraceae bacterium]
MYLLYIAPFIGFLTLVLFILWRFWANLTVTVIARQHRCGRRRAAERIPGSFRLTAPKPPWVKDEVIRLKALMPDGSCRKIAAIFNRRFENHRQMRVGRTYVSTVIRKHHYEIQVLRKKIKHRRPKPIAKNRVWGIDLTGKVDGRKNNHAIFGVVEHASRAALILKGLPDKSSITLLRCLLNCIEQYGKPTIIRTDNEAVFTSQLFRFALKMLGIRHHTIDLHCPWQNGKVERFFGTLKQKLNHWEVDSLDQLNVALPLFRFWYNHVRPHQYLDDRTPAEVWADDNVFQRRSKKEFWFEAWDGLLGGYYLPP